MLEVLIKQRKPVERLCESAAYHKLNLDKYALNEAEWELLRELKPILKVCYGDFLFSLLTTVIAFQ